MEKHSEKGLKTLELLGTQASDWGLVEIKWVKELRKVPTKVKCPTCYGIGEAHFELDGSLAVNKIDSNKDYYKWNDRQREILRLPRNSCPTCPSRHGWRRHYGTGEVVEMVEREVLIGYIQWQSNLFDSRFQGWDHCNLCNKVIKKSGRVPVHGKDQKGVIHNMWVGEDCARKFLGIAKKFGVDHFLKDNLE
jgi:hypothetical protein